MNETHVYEVFQHAGQIYQIRLMLDFNGSNRGFCFVQYHYPEAAKRAIVMFNHLEICEGE
jgi:RNA recognition motif-containing protein